MSDLLLGMNIGTYSSKAALVRHGGAILKTATGPHTMDVPHPGWAEQDANRVGWHDLVALCHELLDGDAYLAGLTIGLVEPGSIDTWNPTRTLLQRDPGHRALHDERYPLYQELYQGTRDVVYRLAAT